MGDAGWDEEDESRVSWGSTGLRPYVTLALAPGAGAASMEGLVEG